jgi:hypothetical protein
MTCQVLKYKSEIRFVIAEATELALLLSEWKIVHVKRDRNQVANALARRNTLQFGWDKHLRLASHQY